MGSVNFLSLAVRDFFLFSCGLWGGGGKTRRCPTEVGFELLNLDVLLLISEPQSKLLATEVDVIHGYKSP